MWGRSSLTPSRRASARPADGRRASAAFRSGLWTHPHACAHTRAGEGGAGGGEARMPARECARARASQGRWHRTATPHRRSFPLGPGAGGLDWDGPPPSCPSQRAARPACPACPALSGGPCAAPACPTRPLWPRAVLAARQLPWCARQACRQAAGQPEVKACSLGGMRSKTNVVGDTWKQ